MTLSKSQQDKSLKASGEIPQAAVAQPAPHAQGMGTTPEMKPEPQNSLEMPEPETPEPVMPPAPQNITINVTIPPSSKSVRMARTPDGGYDAIVEPMT